MANKLISELTTTGTVTGKDYLEVERISALGETKKATIETVTAEETAARILGDNTIEAAVGLNASGTYAQPSGSNYLDSSTDVMDALDKLDDAISSGSGVTIVTETVGVNAANLNNAWAAPFELISAPGATAVIEIISCSIRLLFNTTPVSVGTDKLIIQYDTGASHFMEWSNSFIESGVTVVNKATWTSNVTMITNKKIELTFDGVANPISGDSQLKVFLTYKIWDWSV